MIIERALKTAIAVAAVASATALSLIAGSFALYALLQPYLGRPGAAAIVALVFALTAIIVALVTVAAARGRKSRRPDPADQGMVERLIDLARSKPILAAGAAIAAGLVVMRNPAVVAVIVSALMNKPDRRR